MTVFITFAPVDREVAEELEKFIERRGQFAELDDGQTALRPVQPSDVVVLVLSKDFVFAPTRLRLEQRALDAWSDGRLLVVKLDTWLAPVGLRDLPTIDASLAAQREFKWQEIADAVRETLKPAARPDAEPAQPAPRKSGGVWPRVLIAAAVLALGLTALATMSIWTLAGLDGIGAGVGLPAGITPWIFVLAIALMLVAIASLLLRRAPAVQPEAQVQTLADAVFVSYARANQSLVLPVIEAAQAQGRRFWLDKKGIVPGDAWAGEIVRAIKGSAAVMVMCSKAAFESDHVKREIYLADRYRKKLSPVYIEAAEAPEDFEYFFAGVQGLNLFETPEAERPRALMRALGAP